jgi:hypothetical protein
VAVIMDPGWLGGGQRRIGGAARSRGP